MSDNISMADQISALKENLEKFEKQNVELTKQNTEMKEQIAKLMEKIGAMEIKIDQTQPIARMDQKHEDLIQQLEKIKIAILTGRIHEIELAKFDSNAYKWNAKECGRDMAILEDGFVAKYIGKNHICNCVRAVSPVPAFHLSNNKTDIAFYFEVELLKKHGNYGFDIGFCTQQFPLEGHDLWTMNSIQISHKGGITTGHQNHIQFKNVRGDFKEGEIIGAGIIHCPANSTMQCFSTCNGQFLGKAELPKHFNTLQLFPAITTSCENNTIRANFGKKEWRFKQLNQVLGSSCDEEWDWKSVYKNL